MDLEGREGEEGGTTRMYLEDEREEKPGKREDPRKEKLRLPVVSSRAYLAYLIDQQLGAVAENWKDRRLTFIGK